MEKVEAAGVGGLGNLHLSRGSRKTECRCSGMTLRRESRRFQLFTQEVLGRLPVIVIVVVIVIVIVVIAAALAPWGIGRSDHTRHAE